LSATGEEQESTEIVNEIFEYVLVLPWRPAAAPATQAPVAETT
jgi:hypothetical protein